MALPTVFSNGEGIPKEETRRGDSRELYCMERGGNGGGSGGCGGSTAATAGVDVE